MSDMSSLVVCGAVNWDTTCFVGHLPVPGEEVTVGQITCVSGGTAGNVAVAAARILGARQVDIIAALGDDEIGGRQVAALEAEGVNCEGVLRIAGQQSGQAFILVDRSGQNVIASHLGANAALHPDHVDASWLGRQLEGCRGIVLTDPPLEMVKRLIEMGNRRGVPVLWDPGILITANRDAVHAFAREVAVLFLNEAESCALLGADALNTSMRRLQELGVRSRTVLKLGGRGAVMAEPERGMVLEAPALPLGELGMGVINAVGCGDAFVGAFAAYCALGAGFDRSLLMAGVAAGLNAARPETRGSPDRVTLEKTADHAARLGFAFEERGLRQY